MSDAASPGTAAVVRDDGAVGVRNRVLVLPSVICSHVVAERIADRVPGAVATPHDHGCAQLGADIDQTKRTFCSLATNPNVAGTLVVGLGCEGVQSDDVAAELDDRGVPVREVAIQDVGGTDECIDTGATLARELVEGGSSTPSAGVSPADLTVGVVVGAPRESNTEVAEPVVGEFVDELVDAGGRAILAGVERFVAHPDEARARATPAAAEGMATTLERHRDRPAKVRRLQRMADDTPFDALTGAIADRPVEEVVEYGAEATLSEGVALLDSPSEFAEAATGLVAAGAQLIVHVTADGVTTGHPLAPVVKVSGDGTTVEALPEDIDVDARSTGGAALHDRVLAVAEGERCRAEEHGVTEFAITRVGPSM
ncbi:UxaA family hydrolase [Haloplanus halophilus]|uniref:UxaA family hydrolase n=1 Tax=Haloplanus halophilus TaxID=2949993 RepID=UPI0020402959|nr:UxaA family hydrolase [Haloplanus sp. GDY1]